jgi:hypothetical protein
LLLAQECDRLRLASEHLQISAEKMAEIYQAVAALSPALIDSAERAQTHARALAERLQEHRR